MPIPKNCLVCQKEFFVKKGRINTAKWCSKSCMITAKPMINKKCNKCNADFVVHDYRKSLHTTIYYSQGKLKLPTVP